MLFFQVVEPSAFAGHQSTGGGGDAFICQMSEIYRFKGMSSKVPVSRVYLADTYKYLERSQRAREIRAASFENIWTAAVASLNETRPGNGDTLLRAFHHLKFHPLSIAKFKKDTIEIQEDFPDDHIMKIPKNCRKTQLAIQDWSDGVIEFDAPLYQRLSPAEQALFLIHESLIYLRKQFGDTTLIRQRVSEIVSSNEFYFALRVEKQKKH